MNYGMPKEVLALTMAAVLDTRKHPRKRLRVVQDTTSIRRHKEAQAIYTMAKYIPMEKSQLEKANQPIVLRLAVQYVKLRKLFQENFRDPESFGFSKSFHGFCLVVDMTGTIVYASNNITELLGPQTIDIIGQDFLELLHTEDKAVLKELNVHSTEDLHKLRQVSPMVLRMKTNMSPTIRSQSKIQYKNVLVTSKFKRFKFYTSEGDLKDPDMSSILCLSMCRTEEQIGIPEITINGSCSIFLNQMHQLVGADWKAQWFTGYRIENVRYTQCRDFRHPAEATKDFNSVIMERNKTILKEGICYEPPHRIITCWGQWIWVESEFKPISADDKEQKIVCKMTLLGPVEDDYPVDDMQTVKNEPPGNSSLPSSNNPYAGPSVVKMQPEKLSCSWYGNNECLVEQSFDHGMDHYLSNSSPSNVSLTGSMSNSSGSSDCSFDPTNFIQQEYAPSFPHPSRSSLATAEGMLTGTHWKELMMSFNSCPASRVSRCMH